MRISFITSECVPFVKTGGLADVSGSLPVALGELGCEVKVFLPLYDSVQTLEHDLVFCEDLRDLNARVGNSDIPFNTWFGSLGNGAADVYLIDCPHYFHRGRTYTNDPDEDERFLLLQRAAFRVMQQYDWAPDVLHANDWQAGLVPALLHHVYHWDGLFAQSATVFSIHNIAYQGRFPLESIHKSGLPGEFAAAGAPAELAGSFSFMKAGIALADVVTTVSEQYAREIQTPEFGAGLEGVLSQRSPDLYGILNGIDTDVWNPATDALIATRYDTDRLNLKRKNKKAVVEQFGLPFAKDTPLLGVITRLTHQKGLELLQPILPGLIDQYGLQFVILGSGERAYHEFLEWAKATYPEHVGIYIGYSESLSHQIEAGADIFLMPSRFEPCGLNQMYSLAYGTVPIVRKVGGLADTVHDFHEYEGSGNGFSFVDFSAHALYTSIVRALELFADKKAWRALQERGMATDFSWRQSASRYITAYEHALTKRRGSVRPFGTGDGRSQSA